MAGVPFEPIEQLATSATSAAARELLARRMDFTRALAEVDQFLRSRRHGLDKEQFRVWHKAVKTGVVSANTVPTQIPLATAGQAASRLASAATKFDEAFDQELLKARQALHQHVSRRLPDYLVFASDGLRDVLGQLVSQSGQTSALPLRTKKVRARERHLVLYLQRVCTKNDTLSAFGPAGWGRVADGRFGVRLSPKSGIVQRESFLERWAAHGAAAALNADPDVRSELAPRIHPNGRIDGDRFFFAETGESISLDAETLKILRLCDGKSAAHSLGIDPGFLEKLKEQKLVRWEVEVPALDPYAFEILVHDVAQWRNGPVRQRWSERLDPIANLPMKFRNADNTATRIEIMGEAQKRLEGLGAHHIGAGRALYAATNPIGEECLRECNFTISKELIDEVTIEAAPWIDLWRDCYAFVAGGVAAGLRQIFETAGQPAIPLPAFLRLCESAKLSLTGPGMVALAHIAFQEIKVAFRELMISHVGEPEYKLTLADCHFVRRRFQFPKFDEFTYPSADLQLAAKSSQAVAAGDYQWILAELHPPVALLHHGFYWSCPDPASLSADLSRTVFEKPSFYFGFSAADFTATTAVRFLDALPDSTYFVAPLRSNARWRTVAPAETEIYVDAGTGDVCLRKISDQQPLGSFARGWLIPLGFHPFQFGMAPHMPRLRCGKVIVQRRAWTVTLEELGKGDFTGVSRDLVLAVERLRGARDLPRFVYIRPTEQALRRSGAEGRDKDTKPVFIDLESYLFLEIFHRWLTKAGEIEVTEMLPAPDELLWQEPDGRRTFEMRTLVIPRE